MAMIFITTGFPLFFFFVRGLFCFRFPLIFTNIFRQFEMACSCLEDEREFHQMLQEF